MCSTICVTLCSTSGYFCFKRCSNVGRELMLKGEGRLYVSVTNRNSYSPRCQGYHSSRLIKTLSGQPLVCLDYKLRYSSLPAPSSITYLFPLFMPAMIHVFELMKSIITVDRSKICRFYC